MTEDPSDEVRGPGLRIARHYASEAEAYRDLWAPVLVRLARWLTDQIPLRDARRILDLGCGVGALLPHLHDAAPEAMVVGLDRTQAMVALGPRAFPVLVGDAVQLPFRDRSFDAVVTTFMLFHLPDPTAGLAEARRVLRPGGWIGLLMWGSERDSRAPHPVGRGARRRGRSRVRRAARLARVGRHAAEAAGASASRRLLQRQLTGGDVRGTTSHAEFVARRTNLGSCQHRWASLPEEGRRALLGRARQWLMEMSSEDFEEESEVIVTVARPGTGNRTAD